MKKTFLFALALTLLSQSVAGAETDMLVGSAAVVVPMADPIALLTEPSVTAERLCEIPAGAEVTVLAEIDEGFTRVHFQGKRGYVPSAALDYAVSLGGLSIRDTITDAQRENLNAFLTAFTETGFAELSQGAFFLTDESGSLLAEFAARRVWLDAPGTLETGTCDEAYARLPASVLASIVDRYFGVTPDSLRSADGFFDWHEKDDDVQGGSAVLTNVIDMGMGDYTLYFEVRGADANLIGTGRAGIRADNLDDPESFALSSIVVNE